MSGRLTIAWGLAAGLAFGWGGGWSCATSDQMLEKRRRRDGTAQRECRPGIEESCYSGPDHTLGRGECTAGRRQCTDNGLLGLCTGEVLPQIERCNNLDDDCDGIVDNGFERDGALCEFSDAQGACRTQGQWRCSADGSRSQCDAPIVRPTPETCDAIDNDCDGEIDEDAIAPDQKECMTGKAGVCAAGTQTCVTGRIRCIQNVQPGSEICNGLDDDCNNQIDDRCVKQ